LLSTLLSQSIRLNARAFSTGEMVRPDFLDHGISAMARRNSSPSAIRLAGARGRRSQTEFTVRSHFQRAAQTAH
jgi:hypothetical protein